MKIASSQLTTQTITQVLEMTIILQGAAEVLFLYFPFVMQNTKQT